MFGWKSTILRILKRFGNNFSRKKELIDSSFHQDIFYGQHCAELENFSNANFTNFGYEIVQYVDDFVEGGLERFVLDLALEYRKAGITNCILFSGKHGKFVELARLSNFNIFHIDDGEALDKFVKKYKPNVLLLHHCYKYLDSITSKDLRLIEVMHNPYWWQIGNEHLVKLRGSFSKIVCVSKYVSDFAINSLDVSPFDIVVIKNFQKRVISNLKVRSLSARYTFIHIGNLNVQKNHLLILKSFHYLKRNNLKDATIIFLQAPDSTSDIFTLMQNYVLEHNLTNYVTIDYADSADQIQNYLSNSSIFVLASSFEGFSLATLEAMKIRLPLVLTPCGGYMEICDLGYPVNLVDNVIPNSGDLDLNAINKLGFTPSQAQILELANAMMETYLQLDTLQYPQESVLDEFIAGEDSIRKYMELARIN